MQVMAGLSLERRRQLLLRSMDCFQHWTGAKSVSGEHPGRGYGGHKLTPLETKQLAEEASVPAPQPMTPRPGTSPGDEDGQATEGTQ